MQDQKRNGFTNLLHQTVCSNFYSKHPKTWFWTPQRHSSRGSSPLVIRRSILATRSLSGKFWRWTTSQKLRSWPIKSMARHNETEPDFWWVINRQMNRATLNRKWQQILTQSDQSISSEWLTSLPYRRLCLVVVLFWKQRQSKSVARNGKSEQWLWIFNFESSRRMLVITRFPFSTQGPFQDRNHFKLGARFSCWASIRIKTVIKFPWFNIFTEFVSHHSHSFSLVIPYTNRLKKKLWNLCWFTKTFSIISGWITGIEFTHVRFLR